MDNIIVLGGGGHAKVVISIIKKLKNMSIYGYISQEDNGRILGVEYRGGDDILKRIYEQDDVKNAVIAIGNLGNSDIRINLEKVLSDIGYQFPAIISPNASINEDVNVGSGTVIMDGVVINAGTRIGRFAIINTRASIDHDCSVGDFVHIAPGVTISGGVNVGKSTFIGAGSTIIHYKSIAGDSVIGAGTVVTEDCKVPGKYVGVPARLME